MDLQRGCWIEGSWGQYGVVRLQEIAEAYGWTGERLDADAEFVNDAADEAEAYMNESVAPEGYSFGWHDGEFFLWSDADWEESS